MLWKGSKLETRKSSCKHTPSTISTYTRVFIAVPTNVSIWSWIFDDAWPNSKFNPGRKGGFRDAKSKEFLSFHDIKAQATYLSTAVAHRYGIKEGSHVSIFCSNSIWYPVVTFSTVRLGAIVTGSSPEYGVDEMTYILKASESELVYADRGSWDTVCKAAEKVGLGKNKVVLLGSEAEVKGQTGKVSIQDLIREAEAKGSNGQVKPWEVKTGQTNKDAPSYLSFTSGTTSLPKGVCWPPARR